MKKIIINVLLLLAGFSVYSQQDAQYTQYMYNTININPAYAGSRNVLSIFGLHRTQWVGIDGAPVTNTFSLNSPIGNSGLGIGLSFVGEKIGPTEDNKISADISYTIKTSEVFNLSFGLKGTASLFSFDKDKLNIYSPDSNLQSISNEFRPNVGAGLYLHSDRTYLGVSVPYILESKKYSNNDIAIYSDKMHFHLIGGHVFDVSQSVLFKPSFLLKSTAGAPLQLDLSGNFLIHEKFVLGAAWRWDAAFSFMAGFQITEGTYLGYGYDLETTKLSNYNSGSHEIFLRFDLFSKQSSKIISPRFF